MARRGRPLKFNIEEIEQTFYELLPKAQKRLRELYKESKGVRTAEIFGTQTSLPKWVEESLDIIEANQLGRNITYEEKKQIKENLKSLKQLTSKQARVYERALDKQLTEQYIKDLEAFNRNGSKLTQKTIKKIKSEITKLTPRERQKLLTSKSYQDVRKGQRYKKIRDWALADSGKKQMTYEESYIHLINRRLEDGLNVGNLEDII